MLATTRAIVLRTVKFSENQLIVDMLTEQLGRMSAMCRIPKTQKGRLKKQFFQPLSILELQVDHRPNRQLQHMRDARLANAYTSIPFDATKLSVALFTAEFLTYATRNEQPNLPLFRYVESSLLWLDANTTPMKTANFHLVFMMRLSRFVGFYPNLEGYVPGAFFDLEASSFTSFPPLHANFLSAADSALVVTLMRMTFDTMHLFRFSRDERNRCTEVILTYYRLHVPAFPELRSLPILQQLF